MFFLQKIVRIRDPQLLAYGFRASTMTIALFVFVILEYGFEPQAAQEPAQPQLAMGDTSSITPRVSIFFTSVLFFLGQDGKIINSDMTITILPSGRSGSLSVQTLVNPSHIF